MNLSKSEISQIANSVGLDYARLMAFVSVESGGVGFNPDGHLIIQFEPTWFHKYLEQFKIPHTFSSVIDEHGNKDYVIQIGDKKIVNGVEGQKSEWVAFNIAFSISPKAAMLSTSIGLMQIMGFNYATMGYDSVDHMWDDFKKGEAQQLAGGARFIKNNNALYEALRVKNWPRVAYLYNGEKYRVNNYDVKLANAYAKYSS